MAGETPEDIVEIGLKCIICSKPCVNKEKIHIFGNCSARWPEIILQSLDVDLSCYANYCELIFCKRTCYKRLTNFERATFKVKKIKTDSVQSSSNTCKNYVLKIYSQHGNFLNAI